MNAPIFVVGTMRSGSTLLRLVLDSHPRIAIGEETGFMGALSATKAIPNWRYGREWYGRLGWSEDELDARLREFYAGMFSRYAERQGKARWGDKTPFHSWHMAQMAQVFPDAVFVAIARHPGAVVASLKKRFHWDVVEAARYWESTNVEVLCRGVELGASRFALLRYEDLVAFPGRTLRELIDWLGEPWSDDVLRHAEVQKAKGAPRLVDGSTSTRNPIDASRNDRWHQYLDERERSSVADATRDVALYLGYDANGVTPSARLVPAGSPRSLLLTGDFVSTRQAESGHLTSLRPRDQVLVVPEMDIPELAARLRQAEASLARIRSRPIVRYADTVSRFRRRLPVPRFITLFGR
jgi:Sulfotransferase family